MKWVLKSLWWINLIYRYPHAFLSFFSVAHEICMVYTLLWTIIVTCIFRYCNKFQGFPQCRMCSHEKMYAAKAAMKWNNEMRFELYLIVIQVLQITSYKEPKVHAKWVFQACHTHWMGYSEFLMIHGPTIYKGSVQAPGMSIRFPCIMQQIKFKVRHYIWWSQIDAGTNGISHKLTSSGLKTTVPSQEAFVI